MAASFEIMGRFRGFSPDNRHAIVQVDQRGPGAGMTHVCHQLAQACPGGRGQDVAGMAQVVEVDLRRTCLGERWQPYAAAEVAAP
jgi:hypothetical protein